MKKNLLIFTGSTDPGIDIYKKRYDLVINEAKTRGYTNIQLVSWNGQMSSGKKGVLSMQNSVVDAIFEIEKFDKLDIFFDLIAFSWGCGVALRSLQLMHYKTKYLGTIALWEPSPYWKEYEIMEVNKYNSINSAYDLVHCIVDNDYLAHQVPIEYLLHSYTSQIKLKIGCSTKVDDYFFLKYIESIVCNQNVSYHYLNGLDHVVVEPNEDYFNFLFNT